MLRRHTFALLWLALTGCATPPPAAPELLLRLPPSVLGRRLAMTQQLRIWVGGREFELEALIEVDEQLLRLAMLAFTQPLARLEWDGTILTMHSTPGWPAAVSAERVLSDLVLVLWPAEVVAAALPADWSLRHDSAGRELLWKGSVVQRVSYDNAQRTRLEHLTQGYRMQIDSLSLR